MYILVGFFTVVGLVCGVLLPVLMYVFLRLRVAATLRMKDAHAATRLQVEEIFALQSLLDMYSDGDFVREDGTRKWNFFHRTLVFLNVVKYPALLGAAVGFIVDNILTFVS